MNRLFQLIIIILLVANLAVSLFLIHAALEFKANVDTKITNISNKADSVNNNVDDIKKKVEAVTFF